MGTSSEVQLVYGSKAAIFKRKFVAVHQPSEAKESFISERLKLSEFEQHHYQTTPIRTLHGHLSYISHYPSPSPSPSRSPRAALVLILARAQLKRHQLGEGRSTEISRKRSTDALAPPPQLKDSRANTSD